MHETNPTPQPSQPSSDLSPRVVQLARMIERLPPGTYEISLQKQELSAQAWNVEIVRTERISSVNLSKHNPRE
jgi:hypothetical protein